MVEGESAAGQAVFLLLRRGALNVQKCWVGFDLGGTKMLAAAFNDELAIVGRRRRKTKGNEGARAGMDRVAESILEALTEAGLTPELLAGIGIGCPGTIDLDKGQIVDSANLGWKHVQVQEILEKRFGCPVAVLNDVDAGVYGEYRFGAGKNSRSLLGVFPGTGIGGGFVYDGTILHGRQLSCFEIGHVQVNPNGAVCGCGRIGCLETEASRLAIAAAAASAAYRGEAPHLLAAAGCDLNQIRSGAIAEAIKKGDKAIEAIVLRAAALIGRTVGDVVNLLAPDVVVLGGGLVEALGEPFVAAAEKAARDRAAPPYQKSFKVAQAKLGDDAVVRGAVAWAQKQAAQSAK